MNITHKDLIYFSHILLKMLRFLFIYIYDKWSELSWVKEKSFYLISSVELLSRVQQLTTTWTAVGQASPSITIS